jgi:hypothetical protein
MRGRRVWIPVLVAVLAAAVCAAAYAKTVTRQQNPQLRVTVTLTPSKPEAGQKLIERITVQNVTNQAHRVTVEGELDGPTMGEGFSTSPVMLAPHSSKSFTQSMRARSVGRYTATGRASDALGASHATVSVTVG